MRRSAKKTLWALAVPFVFTACATIGPPQPPSLELPKPPSDLRVTRKGDHVALTWTAPIVTSDRQTIRSLGPTRICRRGQMELTQCGVPVGEVPAQPSPGTSQPSKQKGSRSYTDSLPAQLQSDDPYGFITYAVEVLNPEGRGAGLSNQVRVSSARTLPSPRDFAANVTGQGVVLSWTNDLPLNPTKDGHYIDRIYRRPEGSSQQTLAGEIPTGSERNPNFTDSSVEWEKTYEYHAETVRVIAQENKPELALEGDDTPEIKVFTHDVFPPSVPSALQAVSSGPGQKTFVDLVWAPVADVDLEGYNVYRHEVGGGGVKLNAETVKTPAYRDPNVESGKHYFYSVSAVDVRGNESARSEEADEKVP